MARTEAGGGRWFAVRALLSVGLLAILLARTDWADIVAALRQADPVWILAANLAFVASQALGALRWKAIASSLAAIPGGIDAGFALGVTFSSLWYSNFLPSSFGGDAVRVAQTWGRGRRMLRAVTASILDRYFGLAGLLLVTVLCLPFFAGHPELKMALGASVAVFAGLSLAVVMLPLPSLRRHRRLGRVVVRFVGGIHRVLRSAAVMRRQAGFTLASTLCGLAAYWFSSLAVGLQLSAPAVFVASASAVLASALPVSLAGWGVREGTLVSLLGVLCGVGSGQAMVVAMINATTLVTGSLIGWAVQFRRSQGAVMFGKPN